MVMKKGVDRIDKVVVVSRNNLKQQFPHEKC